ncbi:MAG: hypothetical protein MZU95_10610 [Desulfomicrobium escambiense]|nr:hypothetical protein [Desulfomicrobium escambiense]
MAFSFATTYALGQVAKRYYAGGRTMSTAAAARCLPEPARPGQGRCRQQYLPQIQQKAEHSRRRPDHEPGARRLTPCACSRRCTGAR